MNCIKCTSYSKASTKFCPNCGWNQSHSITKLQTLGEIYQNWSKLHFRRVQFKSIEQYQCSWRKLSVYENINISVLNSVDYQEIIDSYSYLSKSAQAKIKHLISQLCQHAMMHNIIHVNFAKHLILDGYDSETASIFTDKEISKLYLYSKNSTNMYFEAACITLVLIFTGLRPNELFKLKKENVDLRNNFIQGGSKTKAGKNRFIPIMNTIKTIIAYRYLACAPNDYIFTGAKGSNLLLRNWRIRQFYPLMSELGFNSPYNYQHDHYQSRYKPRLTPYSCRHTFASLAYRAGVLPELLIKIVGHTTFKLTSEVYIHVNNTQMQKEVAKISNLTHNEILLDNADYT